jgi:hypothetical protein
MANIQLALDGFDLPAQEIQQIVASLSQAPLTKLGAIWTRREVVEFMLDLAGYCVEEDLARTSFLEPSFGQGDFLLVAVERLLTSYVLHGGEVTQATSNLSQALRAVELHQESFYKTRGNLLLLLEKQSLPPHDASLLADTWLVHDDFLLTDFSGHFTHIVGNPPYVRQELLPEVLLAQYKRLYRTIYDRADLYIPFIERSLSLLSADGTLTFLCSDRWMKNRYGEPLRKLIAKDYHLLHYIDMTGVDAFKTNVIAYPAITVITTKQSEKTSLVRSPQLDSGFLQTLAKDMRFPQKSAIHPHIQILSNVAKRAEPWTFHSSEEEQTFLHRLEQTFSLLEEEGCQVGIGVATGCDSIFIGKHNQLPIEEERKLPLLMTDDMKTGQIVWSGNVVINPFEANGKLIDLEHYPLLKTYFSHHQELIKQRHVARKNPHAWYRTIDKIHSALTLQPKLLIPDIKGSPHVVYDEGHYYPHHNLYVVTSSTWDLQALQAILRSSIAHFFVAHYSVKMRGGYLRFQAQNLRRIRLPRWEQIAPQQRERLRQVASQPDQSVCDEIVFDLYHLNQAERQLLLEQSHTLK